MDDAAVPDIAAATDQTAGLQLVQALGHGAGRDQAPSLHLPGSQAIGPPRASQRGQRIQGRGVGSKSLQRHGSIALEQPSQPPHPSDDADRGAIDLGAFATPRALDVVDAVSLHDRLI